MRTPPRAFLVTVPALLLAACTAAPGAPATPGASPTTGAAATSPAASPTATANACAKENLQTERAGRLTIGTDNPAYPPWFEGGTKEGSGWEINDPSTGQGFESAVAYAVAQELGFSRDEVTWTPIKFEQSFAPGDKPFDFHLSQVSYKPERAQAVDFSESYYDVNQALVALEGTPIANAKRLADLKGYKLGAQVGTTSYDYIVNNIQPNEDPSVYDSNDAAISALNAKQIHGIVVDLPSAFFITAAQLENGVIVGQFPTVGEQERFGLVLEKGSPLTPCVNEALAALRSSGRLAAIQQEWLADKANAPVLQ